MNNHPSTFSRRLLWYILVGISLYWFGNVMAVFPWLISKTLGIIAMFLSTVLWGYITYYCLRHVPRKAWNRDTIFMAIIFLFTAVIEDYFLYAVYRGIPDELYEPTTFLAYGIVLLLPFFVRYVLLRKYVLKSVLLVSNAKLIITALIGIISCAITLWSVKFW
jgi:hypothetical protein